MPQTLRLCHGSKAIGALTCELCSGAPRAVLFGSDIFRRNTSPKVCTQHRELIRGHHLLDPSESAPHRCALSGRTRPEVLDSRTLAVATQRCPGIGFTGPCDPAECDLGWSLLPSLFFISPAETKTTKQRVTGNRLASTTVQHDPPGLPSPPGIGSMADGNESGSSVSPCVCVRGPALITSIHFRGPIFPFLTRSA